MTEPDRPACTVDGCTGAQLPSATACLEHVEPREFDRFVGALGPGAELDLRGTRIGSDRLARVLEAVSEGMHVALGALSCAGSQFLGKADFSDLVVEGAADFAGSTFQDGGTFRGAHFAGPADFGNAVFEGDIDFGVVSFAATASFVASDFRGTAHFEQVEAAEWLEFDSARFGGRALFVDVRVQQSLSLRESRFAGEQALEVTTSGLLLTRASFGGFTQVEGTADWVAAEGAHFAGGAVFYLRWTDSEGTSVSLERMTTDRTVTLAPLSYHPPPQLRSVAGVDASRLVLVDLDLSRCQFEGAYNLDQLRLEGDNRFAIRGRRRQMLYEELDPDRRGAIGAERLATIYRHLRKAQEDAKNEPGAADFYYGEMEMRRHARSTPRGERWILALYWALSGYGLRASRALVALVLLLVLTTAGFATVGFNAGERTEFRPVGGGAYEQVAVPGGKPGWGAAVEHSLDSATSLLRTVDAPPLTFSGKVFEVAVRLLGPLLLGLAVLAVRNRVKR